MTNEIKKIRSVFDRFFSDDIDLSYLKDAISNEISSIDNKGNIVDYLLNLDATIDSIEYTVSVNNQKSEIEKAYQEFLKKLDNIKQ